MKINKYIIPVIIFSNSLFFVSCDSKSQKVIIEVNEPKEEGHNENIVRISEEQDEVLQLKFEHLKKMNLSEFVSTSGKLQVPPQNQASISSPIGANVASINVIEGDIVQKGQVLATLTHPALIQLQVDYQESINQLEYLKKDYERQEMLLKNNVASGKQFQQVKSEYLSLKAKNKGLEAKLQLLNINPSSVRNGNINNSVPVLSTISGAISKVEVNLGKYIEPQTELFEVLNTDELHADLKIFESDITKVKKEQDVVFQINNQNGKSYKAKITTIGKSFEENPRAVMVHSTVSTKNTGLLPGIFITGKIMTGESQVLAVPEAAVVTEGDKSFIFIVSHEEEDEHGHNEEANTHKEEDKHGHGDEAHEGGAKITLKMIEIVTGVKDRGFIEIKPLEKLDNETLVAQNAAYYLLAEMKKGEAEHSH
ncbi:efflux RND transporter periplasmic adaptor subunit [Marinifilum fragile]|uniref:efflux RND transporter periplasmic adaptor subunit n=1 Tax=Marinifilum fragile TaxID=570161 RepID=UPI002AA77DC7|nr:efflux RND transporter periplasmic adaptor subunit [Marinifilum fragile]